MMGSAAVLLGFGAWGAQVLSAPPAADWAGARAWHGPKRWRCELPGGLRRSGPAQRILRLACGALPGQPGQAAGEIHLLAAAHLHEPPARRALLDLLAGGLQAALPKTGTAAVTLVLALDSAALDHLPPDQRRALWLDVRSLAETLRTPNPSPGGVHLEACFLLDSLDLYARPLQSASQTCPPEPAHQLQAELAAALARVLSGGLRACPSYARLSLAGLRASLRDQGARPWVGSVQVQALTFSPAGKSCAQHLGTHDLARRVLADGLAGGSDALAALEAARGWQRAYGLLAHDLAQRLRTRPGGGPLVFTLPPLTLRWTDPPWSGGELTSQLDAWQQEAQRRWQAPREAPACLVETSRLIAAEAARGLGERVEQALTAQLNGTAAASLFLNEAAGCIQDLRYNLQVLLTAAAPRPTLAERAWRWAAHLPTPPDPAACRADLLKCLQRRAECAAALRRLFDPSLPLLQRINPLRALRLVLAAAASDGRVRLAAWREVEAVQAVYTERLQAAVSQAGQSLIAHLLESIALRQTQVSARWNALAAAAHLLASQVAAQPRQPWNVEQVFLAGEPRQQDAPEPRALAVQFLAARPPLDDAPTLVQGLLAFAQQVLAQEQTAVPGEHPLLEPAARALLGATAAARPADLLADLLRRTRVLAPALALAPGERERLGITQSFIGAPVGLLPGGPLPQDAALFATNEENRIWLVQLVRGIDLLSLQALAPVQETEDCKF